MKNLTQFIVEGSSNFDTYSKSSVCWVRWQKANPQKWTSSREPRLKSSNAFTSTVWKLTSLVKWQQREIYNAGKVMFLFSLIFINYKNFLNKKSDKNNSQVWF